MDSEHFSLDVAKETGLVNTMWYINRLTTMHHQVQIKANACVSTYQYESAVCGPNEQHLFLPMRCTHTRISGHHSPVLKSCWAIVDNALKREFTGSSPTLIVLVPGKGKEEEEEMGMKEGRWRMGGARRMGCTHLSALVTRYTSLNCCRLARWNNDIKWKGKNHEVAPVSLTHCTCKYLFSAFHQQSRMRSPPLIVPTGRAGKSALGMPIKSTYLPLASSCRDGDGERWGMEEGKKETQG